jgi:hypothetical protein
MTYGVRELVAMVTTSHIDEATKVVCFLQGLNDGPIKKHLFREYPDTLLRVIYIFYISSVIPS